MASRPCWSSAWVIESFLGLVEELRLKRFLTTTARAPAMAVAMAAQVWVWGETDGGGASANIILTGGNGVNGEGQPRMDTNEHERGGAAGARESLNNLSI